jgi:hypothetical protein
LAQQGRESSTLAQGWLANSDPRIRAWGAYLVLRYRRTDLAPNLLSSLYSYKPSEKPDKDEHDAMLVVLDALIGLHIPVPAREAAKLLPEYPAASLILLSRGGEAANEQLLTIFRNQSAGSAAWTAAGNMLAARRAHGFAAAVISGMTVELDVAIKDSGDVNSYNEGWGISCCRYHPPKGPKVGWPEAGNYTLTPSGDPPAVLLAQGPHPVYFTRTVDALYNGLSEVGFGCEVSYDLARQQYLAELLGAPQSKQLFPTTQNREIVWGSQSAYENELDAMVISLNRDIARAIQELETRGLLTPEEAATARPSLWVNVSDHRQNRDEPPLLNDDPAPKS